MICGVQRLRLPLQQAYTALQINCLKPIIIATASPKSSQNPYVLQQNMDLRPVTSIKPIQMQVNTKECSKKPQLSSASAEFVP